VFEIWDATYRIITHNKKSSTTFNNFLIKKTIKINCNRNNIFDLTSNHTFILDKQKLYVVTYN